MLDRLKEELIKSAIQAEKDGLCKNKSGNFSVMDEQRNYIAITPSGLERKDLTPDQIPILNTQGEIVENKTGCSPSSEWAMHLAVYETRKDFFAVAHTHSHFATSFAICEKEIAPVAFEAYFYGWKTKLAETFLPGSIELAKSVKEPLLQADVVLLKNHGVLTGGKNSEDARQKITYVEDVAQMYYYALQILGKEPNSIKEEQFLEYRRCLNSTNK